jgi:hypothetical protein
MGTRGLVGLRYKGEDKATYNHFDSYPSGLGTDLLAELQEFTVPQMIEAFERIKLVGDGDKPTAKDVKRYENYTDLSVSGGKADNWYNVLRACQGTLKPWITGGVNHMIDGAEFIADSLFCEWGYIVNLDTGKLEVYKGFQHFPHDKGRYADLPKEGDYYPCALVAEFDLADLPSAAEFCDTCDPPEVEEDKEPGYQEIATKQIASGCPIGKTPEQHAHDALVMLRHYCETNGINYGNVSRRAANRAKREVNADRLRNL